MIWKCRKCTLKRSSIDTKRNTGKFWKERQENSGIWYVQKFVHLMSAHKSRKLEKSYLARINELEAQLGQYIEDEPATPTTRNADNEGNVSEDDAAIIREETDAPQVAGPSVQVNFECLSLKAAG